MTPQTAVESAMRAAYSLYFSFIILFFKCFVKTEHQNISFKSWCALTCEFYPNAWYQFYFSEFSNKTFHLQVSG